MKSPLTLVFTALLLAATPAWAADGRVSKENLASLGLSGMRVMSDAEGLSVRGLEGSITTTQTIGVLVVSTRLHDPVTKVQGRANGALDAEDGDASPGDNTSSTSSSVLLINGNPAVLAGGLTISVNGSQTYRGTFSIGGSGVASGLGSLIPLP